MALFGKKELTATPEAMAYRRQLVDNMVFELIPLKSVTAGIEALPADSPVSVTASPVKGLDATVELTDQIRDAGHRPVPHLSARLCEGPEHVARLATWLRTKGYDTIFCVAGDAEEPAGPYDGAHAFLTELFTHDHGLKNVGITSYPDGHAIIPAEVCHEQLHMKQALIKEAGLNGWASTQMCFDTDLVTSWLIGEREAGFELPIHLGIPGVVDRAKLMTMGVRLGVGASLRYLKKNRAAVTKLMAPGHYDPDDILEPLANDLEALGVTGLHVFTFNQVEATENWRQQVLTEA
ncbi:MAG: 5,10-methylenetetrahydrofolate reductase [Acidimicrobiales bacterium]|nr:MAG: 5,10-methylenetetrahydrofolate reductase [Acidimicrobiales bacterium]